MSIVFATGVRPHDELARSAGLEIGERGGVIVDERCRTSDPVLGDRRSRVHRWSVLGASSPRLLPLAEVVCDNLLGGAATFPGADTATKLKLLDVDVAGFGDAFSTGEEHASMS